MRAWKTVSGGRSSIIVLTLLTAMAAGSASATIVKNFEFNTDGVLPSDDPQISYLAPSGEIETNVYSVVGGTLTGMVGPSAGVPVRYVYPGEMHGSVPTNGGISASDPWMYEARVRVLFSEDGQEAGSFTMWNSQHRFQMVFTETGVRVYRGAAFNHVNYACDIEQWHVLRMWGQGDGGFAASVDGVVFAPGEAGISYSTPLANGFFLNLNSHSYGAQVEWDYVRFESGENAVSVEEVSFGGIKALYR